MDRRRGYGYSQPPQIDPTAIDFGQIQMYNPQDTERLAQVGQGMQQRWDTSQMAIAKYMEDIGAADMDPGIRDQVMGKLNADLEGLYGKVQKDYQGDFGRGMHDIVKSLSASRGLMHSAVQGTIRERQAREQYQQAAQQGKINHIFDPITGQRRMQTFEEVHGGKENLLGFNDESGKITGGKYGTLRGAADISGYISQHVTKALNARATQGGLKHYDKNDVLGMLAYYETSGMSPDKVNQFVTQNKEALVNQLKGEVPFLAEELSQLPEEAQSEVLFNYITPIIKNQVAYQSAEKYREDPNFNKTPTPTDPLGNDYTHSVYNEPVELEVSNRNQIDSKYSDFTPKQAVDLDLERQTERREKDQKENVEAKQKKYDAEAKKKLESFREENPLLSYLEAEGMDWKAGMEFMKQQDLRYNASSRASVALHNTEVSKKIVGALESATKEKLKSVAGKQNVDDMFKSGSKINYDQIKVIPSTGQIQVPYRNENNELVTLRLEPEFLDNASNKILSENKQFFKKVYNIGAIPNERREVTLHGNTFEVINQLTENGIEIFIAPKGTRDISKFAHIDDFTAKVNQHTAQAVLTTNSLDINIPKLKLDIWK
jgi:adenylate kinase family enzyme